MVVSGLTLWDQTEKTVPSCNIYLSEENKSFSETLNCCKFHHTDK